MEVDSEPTLNGIWKEIGGACLFGSFAAWLALTGLLFLRRDNHPGHHDNYAARQESRLIWLAWAASGLFWTVFIVWLFLLLFP